MKRLVAAFCTVAAFAAIAVAPGSSLAAHRVRAHAAGIKPLWTEANAPWRTREWAEYLPEHKNGADPSYEPYECKGFATNEKGVTQWACAGTYSTVIKPANYWQVNIDPYGNETYHKYSNSPIKLG